MTTVGMSLGGWIELDEAVRVDCHVFVDWGFLIPFPDMWHPAGSLALQERVCSLRFFLLRTYNDERQKTALCWIVYMV